MHPSADYSWFRYSFFPNDFDSWHNGTYDQSLLNLRSDERVVAERQLLWRLCRISPPDPLAARGLGLLRSHLALEPLKEILAAHRSGRLKCEHASIAAVIVALWHLTHDPLYIDALMHCFLAAPDNDRHRIAYEFGCINDPRAGATLVDLIRKETDCVLRSSMSAALCAVHRASYLDHAPLLKIIEFGPPAERERSLVQLCNRLEEMPSGGPDSSSGKCALSAT